MIKDIFKGFRFGMILQMAIGPVFFFVLDTSIKNGIKSGISSAVAVTIADIIYMILAALGISTIINAGRRKEILKRISGIVVLLFGLKMAADGVTETIAMQNTIHLNSFAGAFLLTISSPVTILFWAGIFGTKMAEDNMNKIQLFLFSAGAALSTLIFLGTISFCGAFIKNFINIEIIRTLHIGAGIILVFLAYKIIKSKN